MRSRWLVVLPSLVLAACGGDSSSPADPPASLQFVAAPPGTVIAGQAPVTAPTFIVKSQKGKTIGNVPVTITVTGGTLTGAPTKTVGGTPTSIGTWTMGTTAGPNTITVTVAGMTTLTATVTGTAGAITALNVTSGDGQSALAGTAVGAPIQLKAVDQYGNVVPNQNMSFAVTAGGGSVAATAVPGDASGTITAPTWTFGKSAVPQQLLATTGTITKVITGIVTTGYNIEVRFWGAPMTTQQQALFTTAAARISAVVTGDLPGGFAPGLDIDNDCGTSGVGILTGPIDDLLIYASVQSIDGPYNVLAQGGPCYLQPMGSGTIIGVMEFDGDDLERLRQDGTLQDVITHEMLHVLGVGTLWEEEGFLFGKGTLDVGFTGPEAILGCQAAGGNLTCPSNVPVENSGSPGTMDSHWRETTFTNELMTGYTNTPTMPFSRITIGSLADLGYTVNYSAADPFSLPSGSVRGSSAFPAPAQLLWEKPLKKPPRRL